MALDLKKDGQLDLNAYLYIYEPFEPKGIHAKGVHVILQYDQQEANNKAVKKTPQGYSCLPVGVIPIKDILRDINFIPPDNPIPFPQIPVPAKKPRATKKQFIYNLQLAADKFCKKSDKEKLLKIIEKI